MNYRRVVVLFLMCTLFMCIVMLISFGYGFADGVKSADIISVDRAVRFSREFYMDLDEHGKANLRDRIEWNLISVKRLMIRGKDPCFFKWPLFWRGLYGCELNDMRRESCDMSARYEQEFGRR